MPDVPGVVNFPTALDTTVSLITASNDFSTTLAADYVPGATTLTVADNSRAQTSGTLTLGTAKLILTYTGKSGSTLFTGIARATNETNNPADVGILTGATVSGFITGRHHGVLRDALIVVETKLGIGSDTPVSGDVLKGTGAGASAWSALTPSDLGGSFVIPTQMINGSWGIWNRGNGPFTADNAWTADGWRIDLNGTSTMQVDREFTDTAGVWSASSGKVTYVQGTIVSRLFNKHSDFAQIRLHEVTFSHYVKSSVASAVRLQISDGVTTTSGSYHTGGGAWERLTVTKTTASTASTTEWAISFEASGTHYVDNGQWVFGPDEGDYLPPDPTLEGVRASLYYQRVDVSLAGKALMAGEQITIPVPWKRGMGAIVGTPNIKRVTAGTATNIAATYPRVNGSDITGGAQIAVTSFGAYISIQSAAGGPYSLIGERLEWEDNP